MDLFVAILLIFWFISAALSGAYCYKLPLWKQWLLITVPIVNTIYAVYKLIKDILK